MADKKISALSPASTPLAGSEVLPIVQSGATVKVSSDDLTVKNVRSNATTGLLQVAGPSAGATCIMTTPNANFTVARTDAANSFTGDQTLATGNLIVSTAGKGITTGGATTLGFGTNGSTTQAVLETGGTLTVGRSSAIVAANSGSLQVYGDLNQVVIGSTVAGTGQSFNLSMSGVGTFFVTNNAGAGVYLTYGATSWTSTSDVNKKNITGQIENALDKVNTLTAARFTWKNDASKTPQVGLIAQEVLEVLPEVVADNGEGVLGVRYTEVIPLLVAAIKELSARVDALEGQ